MEARAQSHLSLLLLKARGGPFLGSWIRWSVETYAEFMAALDALRATDAVTLEEANDFQNRMLAVLGHEPVHLKAGATGLPYVWLGEHHSFREASEPRLIEATDLGGLGAELPWGARFGVHRLERYDRPHHCSLDPRTFWDPRERFAGAMEDFARDTEGLPGATVAIRQDEAKRYLERSVHLFRLADDVDTPYLPKHQIIGGTEGESTYLPGIPASASRLFVEWYGWSMELPIR